MTEKTPRLLMFCLSVTVTFCSANVKISSLIAFQRLELRFRHVEGKKKMKRGIQMKYDFQTGFQERRKGLWLIYETSKRLEYN